MTLSLKTVVGAATEAFDTKANWEATMTPIFNNLVVCESDTGKKKRGNGVDRYVDLPYLPVEATNTFDNVTAEVFDSRVDQSIGAGVVYARRFGVVGDGVTDDTEALQAAIDHVKSSDARVLYLDPGTYLVTDSLNGTYALSGSASTESIGWHLVGSRADVVKIIGRLGTAHPILDMTGNTNGSVRNITITADSSSYASCGVLAASAHVFSFDNAYIYSFSSLTATNVGAVILYSDDVNVNRSVFIGYDGVLVGDSVLPSGIASKWQTIVAGTAKTTTMSFIDSHFVGSRRAVRHVGGRTVDFIRGSAAVVGSAESDPARAVLYFEKACIVKTRDIRIINASSETAHAFAFLENVTGCHLDATFEVSLTDAYVYTTTSFRFGSITSASAPTDGIVFAGGGRVRAVTFNIGRSAIGSITSDSGGFLVTGQTAVSNPELSGIFFRANGVTFISGNSNVFRGNSYSRPVGNWMCVGTQIGAAYIGGSGLQLVDTITLPADFFGLQGWSSSPVPLPRCTVSWIGKAQGSFTVRYQVVASQTGASSSIVLEDWTTPLLMNNGCVEINATVARIATDNAMRAWARTTAGGSISPGFYRNLQDYGFVATSPVVLSLYMESSQSYAVILETRTGVTE